MASLKVFKELALPSSPVADAIYFIKSGSDIKMYVTDSSGNPFVVDEDQTGVGTADTANVIASENLADGDYVNIHNASGNFRVRKADATVEGKQADGYVLADVISGTTAVVHFENSNTSVTGQTPGVVYLSTTPGLGTATAPSGSGNVVQKVGIATSATSVNFEKGELVVLA